MSEQKQGVNFMLQSWQTVNGEKRLKTPVLDDSISLKFSVETRLESESFECLIKVLAFLVQKLWP